MSISVKNGGIGISPAIDRINGQTFEKGSKAIEKQMYAAVNSKEANADNLYPVAKLKLDAVTSRVSSMTANINKKRVQYV